MEKSQITADYLLETCFSYSCGKELYNDFLEMAYRALQVLSTDKNFSEIIESIGIAETRKLVDEIIKKRFNQKFEKNQIKAKDIIKLL